MGVRQCKLHIEHTIFIAPVDKAVCLGDFTEFLYEEITSLPALLRTVKLLTYDYIWGHCYKQYMAVACGSYKKLAPNESISALT